MGGICIFAVRFIFGAGLPCNVPAYLLLSCRPKKTPRDSLAWNYEAAMRTIVSLAAILLFAPIVLFSQTCPSGQVQLACDGKIQCVLSGSTCCMGAGVCNPGNQCGICASKPACVAKGSTCCAGSDWCSPGMACRLCASKYMCVWPSRGCGASTSTDVVWKPRDFIFELPSSNSSEKLTSSEGCGERSKSATTKQ
jgi:hypothetical protein